MGKNLVQKILGEHLVEGKMTAGEPISVRVDQVLTQDATGTMAYLQFEALGLPKIKTPLAVSYVDHNMIQSDFCNPDDHKYLQTAAARYGAYYSRPGNGICHQVHLERFAMPGGILLGSDSHTPTAGGMGMIAMGVGGLDIATTMAGFPYELTMPRVVNVHLTGELQRPWVTSMEVILELLRRLTVKGGVGKIMEYTGPGVSTLNVTERATITNMGAELGATTSVFPTDEATRRYLKAQKREQVYREMSADADAVYDEIIEINLSELEPSIAQPHSPDNVVKIKDIEGTPVDQVCIGSCTNSSLQVMASAAEILKDRTISPNCSMTVSPGSKQVYEMMAAQGITSTMISAGARILESGCGPCIGMGQAPPSNGVSVRSFNRNFKGRSGTPSARVYLANPLSATAIAVAGEIRDPRKMGIKINTAPEPEEFTIHDNFIIAPPEKPGEVVRGPNIKEVPIKGPLEKNIKAPVLLKVEDNITTDHIMPAGSKVLPLRSNIPAISEYVFFQIDPTFPKRAREAGTSIVIGGENYGQGSSREHAALAPMYLGLRAVIVKSLARIHRGNLINFGILPLTFADAADYNRIEQGDVLEIANVTDQVKTGQSTIEVWNTTKNFSFKTHVTLSPREHEVLSAGGLLSFVKAKLSE